MTGSETRADWSNVAAAIGRLIFAAVFAMAASFKFAGMDGTAAHIAAAGFPMPLALAWRRRFSRPCW